MSSTKQIKKGSPPDIAKVHFDNDSHAWNVVIEVDRRTVVLAALHRDHAGALAKSINDCAWVEVQS